MPSMKRLLFLVAIAVCFVFGYAGMAKAWPGVPDRGTHHGYFYNVFDNYGDDVWQGGLPGWVDTAGEFVNYTKNFLYNGNAQQRVGAAFIIQTMIGLSRNNPPSAAEVAEWEARVYYAENQNRIRWFEWQGFSINSFYQGCCGGGGNPIDDAFYYENGVSSNIVFLNEGGGAAYSIRRECANPVGNLSAIPDDLNYDITGRVEASNSNVEPGENVVFSYFVRNNGPTNAPGTMWFAHERPSNNFITGGGPDAYSPGQERNVFNENFTVPFTATPGSIYCRVLAFHPKNVAGDWGGSSETCVTVVKTPYVHFMGNDVWAGGDFATTDAACNGRAKIQTIGRRVANDGSVAGSAGEYGTFALDKITNFGSQGLGMRDPASDPLAKRLTFANSDGDARLGYFGAPTHCIEDYYQRFIGNATNLGVGHIDVGARGTGVWRLTGNHTLSGTMPAGATQVYIVENGQVTINNNLTYPNTYTGVGGIPSLIVISYIPGAIPNNTRGNIVVNANVQTVEGIFVAKNKFITCPVAVGAPMTVSTCNQQLTVNGAVLTSKLELNRTFGGEGNTTDLRRRPAEIFNFRTELLLRNALNNSSQTTIQTTNRRELPPRF